MNQMLSLVLMKVYKNLMGTGTFTSSSTGDLSITPGILVMNTFEGNLTGNVTGNITGNVTGNAKNTVTNGIYTTSSVTELSDISSKSGSIISNGTNNIEENADVTSDNVYSANAVMNWHKSQTITSSKNFVQVNGSITGTSKWYNGVYTSGDK